MTDKEFVLSIHPAAVVRTKDFFGLNKAGTETNNFAIFEGDRKKAKRRNALTFVWTVTEDEAWTQAANILRKQFLEKFES